MVIRIKLLFMVVVILCSGCSHPKMPKVGVEGVTKSSLLEAVKQPIYSTNLIKKKIPENLRELSVVYQAPSNCAEYLEELELLNLALGEDLTDKKSDKKDTFTLNLGQMITDEVESNIPFNSIVKRLSGAKKHEKAHLSAKLRGRARRSYLTGWGDAMVCSDLELEQPENINIDEK